MFPFGSHIYWGINTYQDSVKGRNNALWLSMFSDNYIEALGRYKIKNVPDTCSKEVIMESLLCCGNVAIDISHGLPMSLPATPGGMVSTYGYAESCNLYSANGKIFAQVQNFIPKEPPEMTELREEIYGKPTCAFLLENQTGVPFLLKVIDFTNWMYDTMCSLDVARENSKDLYLLMCEEAIAKNVEKIIAERKRTRDSMKVVSTGVFDAKRVLLSPTDTTINHLKPLTALYEWYHSQFRQKCGKQGIANPDKSERLNIPETQASLSSGTDNIEEIVEYLNDQMEIYNPLLGTNIEFEVNYENAYNQVQRGGGEMAGDDTGNGDAGRPGNNQSDL